LIVEFAAGSRILREAAPDTEELRPDWEPRSPGAFVVFKNGKRVPVPADQIVHDEVQGGRARVGFGGMSFEGVVGGRLIFWRVREIGRASPLDGAVGDDKLEVDSGMVARVEVEGSLVWPKN
jgi:hypothetical protein